MLLQMSNYLHALINAKIIIEHCTQEGYDVFNALELMDNKSIFEELKFAAGDGNLNYYLYNYALQDFAPSLNGLVLF